MTQNVNSHTHIVKPISQPNVLKLFIHNHNIEIEMKKYRKRIAMNKYIIITTVYITDYIY